MKKIVICIIILALGGLNVKADNNQPTWNEIPCTCSFYNPSKVLTPRSVLKTVKAYKALPNIIVSGIQEATIVSITISDSNGMDVKKDTIALSSDQDVTIYIGDLKSGTYDLTIKLENYTLLGSFTIE